MKKILLVLVAAGVVGAGGYGVYHVGMDQGMKMASSSPADVPADGAAKPSGEEGQTGEREVLYWHDPMVPGPRFDKPGKSPFMDMDLVPVYADEGSDDGSVSISPRIQQNLGIRTAAVTKSSFAPVVEAVGSVAYNERDVALVQARSNGFVERLHVRATLDSVNKGQPLAELYVPEWVAAQEDYLYVKRMEDSGGLLDAARQRMRLAGMTEDQIRRVERSGKVQARITVAAPITGVVHELNVREGTTVMSGMPMFRINGLNPIWVHAEVPENLASHVQPGNTVEARTPSFPETTFKGKVSAILPEVNTSTRTIKARIELANPDGRLVPGMFATVNFTPAAREDVLTVPTEAIIETGKRSIVIVAEGDGKFAPVDVETGIEVNGKTEITKGLQEGQKVVASGQFLIDSESSLRGSIARMSDVPSTEGNGTQDIFHSAEGIVESIEDGEIVLSHDPIPSLKWGEMTMGFQLSSEVSPKDIKEGDRVSFELRALEDGTYEVTKISLAGTAGNGPQGAGK